MFIPKMDFFDQKYRFFDIKNANYCELGRWQFFNTEIWYENIQKYGQ